MIKLRSDQEHQLLQECIEHDRCDKFVKQYYHLICYAVNKVYAAKGIKKNKEDIEDRVQEVFEKLFEDDKKKLRQYDPSFNVRLSGWISMIAARTVLSGFRRKKEFLDDKAFRAPAEVFDSMLDGKSQTDRLDARQKLLMIQDVISRLGPPEDLVLKLEWIHGLSAEEIAETLHKTVNNVYVIRHRALLKIRDELSKIRSDM